MIEIRNSYGGWSWSAPGKGRHAGFFTADGALRDAWKWTGGTLAALVFI